MFLLNKVIFSNFKFKNDFKVVLTNPLQTSHLRKTNLKILRII